MTDVESIETIQDSLSESSGGIRKIGSISKYTKDGIHRGYSYIYQHDRKTFSIRTYNTLEACYEAALKYRETKPDFQYKQPTDIVMCECGIEVKRRSLYRHKQTKIHNNRLQIVIRTGVEKP